ncbi:RsmE family RNA methyltransferase [Desulfatibacillum aliphaticivorans]|uniref:RsmE family RNA methyltransferase n=1 Tax=Desulfatibacillum aliphaticivorans TaxID=218208 RepID=UPI0003FD4578|nr:RsmE family RNA methyltransferase [Desulfatibacillum aliphaticivorans]
MAETRRFYIEPEQITGDRAFITGQDAKHAKKVLRLAKGDPVVLLDNSGLEYMGVILSAGARDMEVEIQDRRLGATESPLKIDLAMAMIKTSKMDKLLKGVTELGMHGWRPFYASRSVPKVKDPEDRRDRWKKIAAEAVKQCERVRLPEVHAPVSFEELCAISAEYDLGVVFWEKSRTPFQQVLQSRLDSPPKSVLVVIGPEGGFEDHETARLEESGMVHAGLGPRILRAETAALASCALIQAGFGDLGGLPRLAVRS